MYQKLLKDIPGQVYTPPQPGPIIMRLTRKKGRRQISAFSGIKYDDRSPPDDRKSIRDGEKPAWHFTPDVTAGFTPEPCRLNK